MLHECVTYGISYTYDDEGQHWFVCDDDGQWYAHNDGQQMWRACGNPYHALTFPSTQPPFFTTILGKLLLLPLLGLLLLVLIGMLHLTPDVSQPQRISSSPALFIQRVSSAPQGDYDLRLQGRSPSISPQRIDAILARAGSPAQGEGQHMYDLGVRYGIDPIFLLAFFHHESTFGLYGAARTTLSVGNLRSSPYASYESNGFAYFSSYYTGEEAWYWLLTHEGWYFPAGNFTIASIIPHYAPSSDHNDEAGYIAAVEQDVDAWRK